MLLRLLPRLFLQPKTQPPTECSLLQNYRKIEGKRIGKESTEKMMRMRFLWFTLGFASTSGAIAQFVFKDLVMDRNSISSQLKEKFNSLDTRVANLESAISNQPISPQDEENLG